MKYILYLVILSSLFLQACVDDECIFGGPYLFEMPATLSPAKAIYSIGDTITVSSRFSDMVNERNTERSYELKDYIFNPVVGFAKLDTMGVDTLESVIEEHIKPMLDLSSNFSNVSLTSGGYVFLGQFDYVDNEYSLEYSFVVKKPGLYIMNFASLLNLSPQEHQEFPGKCGNKAADTWTVLNDGADNNVDFLLEAASTAWHVKHASADTQFHSLGGYCYKVE